jgi:DNA-binding NarL/FixJ family response regulator
MTIRLLLVDDHEMMRQGLRSILERDERMTVVGEAASGRDAVERARDLAPDIVVMDVAMKDLNGIEATRQILGASPSIRVVALSSHSDRRYVGAILEAGASGYVLKAEAFEDLRRAIHAVAAGKSYLSPEVTQGVVGDSLRATAARQAAPEREPLSAREREVLQLLAEGLSSPQIAGRLFVATATVETHRRNVMRKLNLHSVAELTKYAVREGLTPLDE